MGFTLNQLEQERQIRKLQKKEDKDTKDYEQLSNLPKINNVELKGDKTTSDLGINANNVMMSDGTTSVEEAVNDVMERMGVNALAAAGTALTYDTEYVAPADGYMRGIVNEGATKYIKLYVKRTNNTWFPLIQTSGNAVGAAVDTGISLFVLKGMSVKFNGSSSADVSCAFIPLSSN